MNVNFSQKPTKVLSTIFCLVLVVAFSLFNQANANALTKLPEKPSFSSGISSSQTTIKSTEPTATELTKSPTITPQESFPDDLTRLLKTNECVGCNLAGAALKDTNLQAANLEGANLQGVDLERANLQRTNLKGANLQGADLGKTNIAGANLANANLFDADLEKANLQGVNLEGANLEGADLEDAILPTAMVIR